MIHFAKRKFLLLALNRFPELFGAAQLIRLALAGGTGIERGGDTHTCIYGSERMFHMLQQSNTYSSQVAHAWAAAWDFTVFTSKPSLCDTSLLY